ncbi:MAG: hypothetical protein V1789_12120, partial [PVC group bacterium]
MLATKAQRHQEKREKRKIHTLFGFFLVSWCLSGKSCERRELIYNMGLSAEKKVGLVFILGIALLAL